MPSPIYVRIFWSMFKNKIFSFMGAWTSGS